MIDPNVPREVYEFYPNPITTDREYAEGEGIFFDTDPSLPGLDVGSTITVQRDGKPYAYAVVDRTVTGSRYHAIVK